MTKMTEERTLTQEILGILKENSEESTEGYNGAEWIKAADLISKLEPPVILAIPWCVFDLEVDEFGENVLENRYDHLGRRKDIDKNGDEIPDWKPLPRRKGRNDALAILLAVASERELPNITPDDVAKMLHNGNIQELTNKAFKFWGVDIEGIAEKLEEMRASAAEGETPEVEAPEAREAESDENFTEQHLSAS